MNQQTHDNDTHVAESKRSNEDILKKLNITPKKLKIGVIISVIIIAIIYLNSASFLRSQLTFGSWYIVFDDGDVSENEIKFYPDGEASSFFSEWEILDDNTLVVKKSGDSTYYSYGDWYVIGFTIVIGDDYKLTRFPDSDN